MTTQRLRSCTLRALATTIAATLLLNACSDSESTVVAPPAATVNMCTFANGGAVIVAVNAARLDSALATRAYLTDLVVDPAAATGDGRHFKTITSAVAAAKVVRLAHNEIDGAACRITISVAAGTLRGSTAASTDATLEKFPIVIDVPDITIRGSTVVPLDASGRPTGNAVSNATIIAPTTPLLLIGGASSQTGVSEELFALNGHPDDGSKGNGAIIENLVLRSGHAAGDTVQGGQGVLAMRVRDVTIRHNRFEGNFTERMDLRATSADVDGNDLAAGPGNTCDVCIAGPGVFTVRNNRITSSGIDGVLLVPTLILPVPTPVEQYTLPTSALAIATVTNNEIAAHIAKPVGAAIRLAAVGVGAPNVVGDTRMTATNNVLRNNTFALMAEAGFPQNGTALRGDITLKATGNTVSQSCQNDVLVSFSRHATGLGLSNQPYLRGGVYLLTLGSEFPWSNAWVAHPAGFGNTLLVNDQPITNGTRAAYDAAKSCPSAASN